MHQNVPGGIPRLLVREEVRPARPLQPRFREEVRPTRHKTPILSHFSCAGRTFSRSRPHPRSSRAKKIAQEARQHGDGETNNTTAHPKQGTRETHITSAPKISTKNAHFSPAKAMTVSIPHRYQHAKATGVSDHRATWPTGPGRGTIGGGGVEGSEGSTSSGRFNPIRRGVIFPIRCTPHSNKHFHQCNCQESARRDRKSKQGRCSATHRIQALLSRSPHEDRHCCRGGRMRTRTQHPETAGVTNVVKPARFKSPCECSCYKRRQSKPKNHYFQPKSHQIDDVCNNGTQIHTKNTSD